MANNRGTKKPGIKSHGTVVMIAELGSAKMRRCGPGDEITPNPTAAIRSNAPIAFQIHIASGALLGRRYANHATGTAVAPTKMSPHPATGANGAGRR